MAVIEARTCMARDGAAFTVRSPCAEDAAAMLALAHDVFATCDYTKTTREEFTITVEQERALIDEAAASPDSLWLVAEMNAALVGSLQFRPAARRRVAHHGSFGMGLASTHRGRGIGGPLLEALLDWAAAHPRLEKVTLGVFPDNAPAVALYRRLGFVEEGRTPRYFKLGPGRYSDDSVMAIYVKPGVAPAGYATWPRR